MRSGVQPVAIPCNESDDHRPFAAFSDVRAPSESAFNASKALRTPILCRKVNFAELAYSEVHRSKHHDIAGCAWRPRNGSQREDRAPAPTTRSTRVRCAPHPLHTKLLGRPSAPDSYQSPSRSRKRMISPHPPQASAGRPRNSTLVMPMRKSPSGVSALCPRA